MYLGAVVAVLLLLAGAPPTRAAVYVADNSAGELLDYSAANSATVLDQGLTLPNPVTLDAVGNIYVCENGTGTVYKYTPAGVKSVLLSGLAPGFGLAFDKQGNLFVSVYDASLGQGQILKVTTAGDQGTFASGLTRPRGLAFDGAGNLYASDLDSGNVYKYTPDGTRSTFATGFNYPTGLAFDASGNLFVCSQGVGVFEVTPAGGVSTFTMNVTDPRDVAIDMAGNVYVTDVGDATGDPGQGTVYLFTSTAVRSTYASNLAAPLGIAITDAASPQSPAFFDGEVALGTGVYYLSFPDGNYFGYYSFLSNPNYIYHFDLGYEYVFDANDGHSGVYFYDFKSSGFFYTSPTFPFPYLYDFSLNTVLYYYPDPSNPGHYNTDGVRYFYDFATGKIISK